MPEVFHTEVPEKNGKGTARVVVLEEFDTSEMLGVVRILIQVSWSDASTEHCSAELSIDPFRASQLAMNPTIQAGAYGLCIIGQVGAKVWNDFQDCLNDARKNDPSGTKKKIWADAAKCLAVKSGAAASTLAVAMTLCEPLRP